MDGFIGSNGDPVKLEANAMLKPLEGMKLILKNIEPNQIPITIGHQERFGLTGVLIMREVMVGFGVGGTQQV